MLWVKPELCYYKQKSEIRSEKNWNLKTNRILKLTGALSDVILFSNFLRKHVHWIETLQVI